MTDVRVVLKDQGVVKSALLDKGLVNAFHDPRWYGEAPIEHPLLALFVDPPGTVEEGTYGTVAIDRDSRWVGSCQGYMALAAMEVWDGGYSLKQCQELDLDAELARFPVSLWGAVFVQPPSRLDLFQKAFEQGFIQQVRAGKWAGPAPWRDLRELGLLDAQSALDWLNARRREIMGDRCVLTQCAFRFAPPGWTIQDYDREDEQEAFGRAMSKRSLLVTEYHGKGLA